MKQLFILLCVLGMTQMAFAKVNLWYGADTYEKRYNDMCFYSIEVPVLKTENNKFNAGIEALNSKFKASAYSVISEFEQNIQEPDMCDEQQITGSQTSTWFEVTTPLSAKFVSIVTSIYMYYGGPHGNTGREAVTFNAKTGKVYSDLSSILKDSSLDALKAKVESKLNIDPSFGWNKLKSSWQSMYDIKNFYLTQRGVTIYFDAYEVAPYAAGPQDIQIAWYELKDMNLKNTNFAQSLIQN